MLIIYQQGGQTIIFEEKERISQNNTIFWVREPILTLESEIRGTSKKILTPPLKDLKKFYFQFFTSFRTFPDASIFFAPLLKSVDFFRPPPPSARPPPFVDE